MMNFFNTLNVFDYDGFIYEIQSQNVIFDFSAVSMHEIIPGNSIKISSLFSIDACRQDTLNDAYYLEYEFNFKSVDSTVGINHIIKVKNGKCSEVCDLYGNCDECDVKMVPIISSSLLKEEIILKIETDNDNVRLITDSITLSISECPLGSGYASDAITIDCNECPINTFKLKPGNEPCYECETGSNKQYECDGKKK
eukprot:117530_1